MNAIKRSFIAQYLVNNPSCAKKKTLIIVKTSEKLKNKLNE